MTPCGCPQRPGRQINDQAAHDVWHALVVQQGGPAGEVNLVTLREARGMTVQSLPSQTVIDDRATASGKHRSSTAELVEARARENARKAACAGLTGPRDEREIYR